MVYPSTYWNQVDKVVEKIPRILEMNYKSVFITGATGMIGSAVTELLFYLNMTKKAGIKIYLAGRNRERMKKRFEPFKEGTDYIFIQYDATKSVSFTIYADYIIHGASNASPSMYRSQPVETMLCNLVGLNSLLEMAVNTKAKRLLYLSSSEVYGQKKNNMPYKEDDYGYIDILNPRASYPSSKRAAETMCAAYGQEYMLDTVIVRPGHIYGPSITDSDDRASAQFTRAAVNGKPIVMKSAGDQLRSYCYTLDCASAILTVLLNGEKGHAYNISNSDSIVSIRDVAEMLSQKAGTKIEFSNPSDEEKRGYNLMNNSALDASKLEELGWVPQFDLRTGVSETIRILKHSTER